MDDIQVQGELLRGNIDTIILKCLFEGDKYGNEIMKDIEERTRGQFMIKQPTLYSSLTRLENQGFVTCTWVSTNNGGRRKYFSMTMSGHEYFQTKQKEWEFSRTVVDKLISEQIFDINANASTVDLEQKKEEPEDLIAQKLEAVATLEVELAHPTEQFKTQAVDTTELAASFAIKTTSILETDMIVTPFAAEGDEISEKLHAYLTGKSYSEDLATSQAKEPNIHYSFVNLPNIVEEEDEEESEVTSAETVLNFPTAGSSADPADQLEIEPLFKSNSYNTPMEAQDEDTRTSAHSLLYTEDPIEIHCEKEEETTRKNIENYRTVLSKIFAPSSIEPKIETEIMTSTQEVKQGNFETLANGVVIRRHNKDLAKEYNEKFYVYANKLRLYQYIILAVVMLVEALACYLSLYIGLGIKEDIWIYYVAAGVSLAFPILSSAVLLTKPEQTQRIVQDKHNVMLYKFFITLECIVLILCINILCDRNVLSELSYLTRLLVPCILATNFMINTLIYNALIKSKRFAVK